MIEDVAAKRYAEAAYLIAREDGTEEAWLDGLTALAALGTEEAQAFLQDSRVSAQRKAQLLETTLKNVDPLGLINPASAAATVDTEFRDRMGADRGPKVYRA